MKLAWQGEAFYHPATQITVRAGTHDYPEEHVAALLRLGLTKAEGDSATKRRRTDKEDE